MLQTLYDFITKSVGQERVHQIYIQALILTAKRICNIQDNVDL